MNEAVKEFYDQDPSNEWNRLEGHSFEFEITKHFLKKYLSGKKILDIGGGPGRYSIWLASEGYDVTLLDLSDANVAFAKKKAEEYGVSIRAMQADARDLSLLGDEVFDHVLLMGPLYHLYDEADRARCVQEAAAHLQKEGLLFASFIALHAGLNYYLAEGPSNIMRELELSPDYLDNLAENKTWCGLAFTEAVFMQPADIVPFFESCGFEKLTLFGQEGVIGVAEPEILAAEESVRQLYMKLSLALCENPAYYAYTNHMMYIGKQRSH